MHNTELLYRLWGKTNERDREKPEDWKWHVHPAICHMVDVGYVAETWLRINPHLLDRFHHLAPHIDRDELGRIIVTIIALHDLGKLHHCFQAKSEEGWRTGYGTTQIPQVNGHGFDHGRATGVIMRELTKETRRQWKPWRQAFDMAAGHHGTLYIRADLRKDTIPPWRHEIPIIEQCLNDLCALFDMPEILPAAPEKNSFYMLLAGFTAVCDWLGSDSTTYRFAELKGQNLRSYEDLKAYYEDLKKNSTAENQLREQGLLGQMRREQLEYPELFEILKKYPLRPLQEVSTTLPFGDSPGSEIVVVEAPMGMGKTEIALYLSMRAIGAGNADGLYFALPTQASSNALFKRITDFADTIRDPDGQLSVVLAHGGSRFFEKYQELKERTWKQKEAWLKSVADLGAYRDKVSPPSEIIATRWLERSKQSLLAGVGVGTIDQAMMGAITVKHAFVRLFALANKVVVFDEIHAYDSYMNTVILHLLEWLHALGAKVILLSATLPRNLRNDLLGAYQCSEPGADTEPENDPYPQILYGRDGKVEPAYTVPAEKKGNDRKIPVRIRRIEKPNEERTETGATLAVDLARNGGCIAWIRNTVKEAQEAWRTVRNMISERELTDVQVRLIHARYTRTDRNAIEEELVSVLGNDPDARRPQKMIVIATQVIEQSVDIDFDAMISDLAPIDLLLQRLGRMWRHERPISVRYHHAEPTLYVLTPAQEEIQEMAFGSSSYVYNAEILARTATLAIDDQVWNMPDSCRTLVATVYDRSDDEWTAGRQRVSPEKLEKARHDQNLEKGIMKSTAERILMSSTTARHIEMQDAYSDDDRSERIALTTRYGGASGTIVLLEERDGAICFAGSNPKAAPVRISPPPADDDFRSQIAFDEALTLSSVSFPWYGPLERAEHIEPEVAILDEWWQDRRPFDNKIFLLLNHEGYAEHPQFAVIYRRDTDGKAIEGLILEKMRKEDNEEEIDYTVI